MQRRISCPLWSVSGYYCKKCHNYKSIQSLVLSHTSAIIHCFGKSLNFKYNMEGNLFHHDLCHSVIIQQVSYSVMWLYFIVLILSAIILPRLHLSKSSSLYSHQLCLGISGIDCVPLMPVISHGLLPLIGKVFAFPLWSRTAPTVHHSALSFAARARKWRLL